MKIWFWIILSILTHAALAGVAFLDFPILSRPEKEISSLFKIQFNTSQTMMANVGKYFRPTNDYSGNFTSPLKNSQISKPKLGDLNLLSPQYPPVSIRREEEGLATLLIEINKDHQIQVSLYKTSGFPNLDQAALLALQNSEQLKILNYLKANDINKKLIGVKFDLNNSQPSIQDQ